MNKKLIIVGSILIVLLLYVGLYFFIKYKYYAVVQPSSYFSSIFDRTERVRAVAFYERNKVEVSFYYIFLPIGKIEESLDEIFIYEIVGFKIDRQ